MSILDIRRHFIDTLLKNRELDLAQSPVIAYAPSNIALCKYWGKRSLSLNLPNTDSVSISLNQYGAITRLSLDEIDSLYVNNLKIDASSQFYEQVFLFLSLFRFKY